MAQVAKIEKIAEVLNVVHDLSNRNMHVALDKISSEADLKAQKSGQQIDKDIASDARLALSIHDAKQRAADINAIKREGG